MINFCDSFFKKGKTKIITSILLIIFSFGVLIPQYLVSGPSLTDDGTDIQYVRDTSWKDILYDQTLVDQRTRPLRFVYRKMLYVFFKRDIKYHFLMQSVLLLILVFLIRELILKLTKNRFLSEITAICVFLLPSTLANYYRLGTDEPLQIILLLLGFLFLVKNDWTISLVMFGLSLFTKETSIFVFILPVLVFLRKKKLIHFSIGILILIGYSALVLFKMANVNNSYINMAHFSSQILSANVLQYPLTYLSVLSVGCILVYLRQKNKDRSITLTLLCLLLTSISSAFWIYSEDYYLFPVQLTLLVSVAEIYTSNKESQKFIVIIGFLLLFIFSFRKDIFLAKYWHKKYLCDGQLSTWLMEADLSKTTIFSGLNWFEGTHKIQVYTTRYSNHTTQVFPSELDWIKCEEENKDNCYDLIDKSRQLFSKFSDKSAYISDHSDLYFDKVTNNTLRAKTFFVDDTCPLTLYIKN